MSRRSEDFSRFKIVLLQFWTPQQLRYTGIPNPAPVDEALFFFLFKIRVIFLFILPAV